MNNVAREDFCGKKLPVSNCNMQDRRRWRGRKEQHTAVASGKTKKRGGVRKGNRRRQRVRSWRRQQHVGVPQEPRSPGNRERERHSNIGEEREQSALFTCAGLRVGV